MKKLIHHDLQQIELVMNTINQLHNQYTHRDFGFFQGLGEVLVKTHKLYEDGGQKDKSLRLKSLKSNLDSVNRGFHPYLFEKIDNNKRDMQYMIALKILKEAEGVILEDYQILASKIEGVKPMIENIILAAFQVGLFKDNNTYSQTEIESAWQQLSIDVNIGLLQKKILLSTSYFDAIILMDKLIGSLITAG